MVGGRAPITGRTHLNQGEMPHRAALDANVAISCNGDAYQRAGAITKGWAAICMRRQFLLGGMAANPNGVVLLHVVHLHMCNSTRCVPYGEGLMTPASVLAQVGIQVHLDNTRKDPGEALH